MTNSTEPTPTIEQTTAPSRRARRAARQTARAAANHAAGAVTASIGPASIETAPRHVRVGDGFAATLIVTGYPAEVGPAWLEPLLAWPGRLDVALHIEPLAPQVAATRLRRQRARLESNRRVDAERGRLGDPITDAAAEDAADLADRVARGMARLFRVGLYLTVHAQTQAALIEAVAEVRAAAASVLLDTQPATWRQRQGWTSTLPLATDTLRMRRVMDTDALATAFPLASADLPAPLPGEGVPVGGVLYGLNTASAGVVWWDRWAQENHNSVVVARSGAGKSYLVKLEVLRSLYAGVRVAVIDPEDEYLRLTDAVGGTAIQLGAPGIRINPFDLPVGDRRPDALTRRALFLHTLIAVLLGQPPPPAERAALDRAILATYAAAGITNDPATWTRSAPLLRDLAATLDSETNPAARTLAARLSPWVDGSFKDLFDGPTTYRPRGHLVVWSTRQLADELRAAGMLLALDAIWRDVDTPATGRADAHGGTLGGRRLVVVDEAWTLLRDGEGAKFLYRLAKAARKRRAGVAVITQDAADLLGSDLGQAVVANAATQILMRQAPQAIDQIADTFGLTAGEARMLLAAGRGEALLLAGSHRVTFQAVASPREHELCWARGPPRRGGSVMAGGAANAPAAVIRSAWRSNPSPAPSPSSDPTLTPDPPQSPLIDAVADIAAWVTARPWLASVAVAILLAGITCRIWVRRWRHQRLVDHAHQVTILPPPEVDPHGIIAWWANLAELLAPSRRRRLLYGTPHIAIEYRWTGRALTVTLWIPGTVATGPVMAAVRAAWPGASCTVTDAGAPVPIDAIGEGGQLAPGLPPWYPLETDHDTDPMRALVSAGSGLHDDEHACVQLLTRPATPRQAARLRRGAAALRTGRPPGGLLDPATWLRGALNLVLEFLTPAGSTTRHPTAQVRPAGADPLRDRDLRPALDKTAGTQWETAMRYVVAHTNPRRLDRTNLKPRLVTLANGLSAAYGAYTGRNRLRRRTLHTPVSVLAQRRFSRGFLLSADELGAIAALPTDLAVPGLDRARARAVPAPVAVPTGGRGTKVLGKAEVGGHAVAVPVADTRQHLHILGSTGSGKSTAMCNLILDDIAARRGVVLIDPKGDLALDVLDRLPASVADRVVLIDPDQTDGARLNPLAGIDGTDTHRDDDLVVDNVVSIFSAIFQRHWGPRIDDVLRVACLTLMRRANADLTLVPPLLQSKQFRAEYTVGLDDPEGLLGFWEWYEGTPASLRAQVIGPVLARLRAFLLRDFVLRTVGTPRSSFDMRRVLDGGILIARLPKGQLGEETAKLLGSFVFASVWQAATARARIPEAQRRDCSIYIDEAHNVLNLAGSVADMLAEARGYHLSLVLAHQNLTQLPRDTQLALSANARNKLFFACSPEDAKQLARHTYPELDEHDLANLAAFTATARLVINSRETAAFTLRTNPPREPVGETTAIRRAVADPNTGGRSAISELARRTARIPGQTTSAGAPDRDPTSGPGSSRNAPRPRQQRP